jgi:hypothetical protein
VSELADDGVPVAVTCRVLKIARQHYYRWLARPVSDAEMTEAYRSNALFDAHRDDPEFGYRFLADEARGAGQAMAERTAWRLCSGNGWWSAFGKKKRRGKGGKTGPPVHDDRVQRDFTAAAPNRLWLATSPNTAPQWASDVTPGQLIEWLWEPCSPLWWAGRLNRDEYPTGTVSLLHCNRGFGAE